MHSWSSISITPRIAMQVMHYFVLVHWIVFFYSHKPMNQTPFDLATNLSISPLGRTPCFASILTASAGAASKALSALVAANAGVVENNAIAIANPVIFLIYLFSNLS